MRPHGVGMLRESFVAVWINSSAGDFSDYRRPKWSTVKWKNIILHSKRYLAFVLYVIRIDLQPLVNVFTWDWEHNCSIELTTHECAQFIKAHGYLNLTVRQANLKPGDSQLPNYHQDTMPYSSSSSCKSFTCKLHCMFRVWHTTLI